MAMQKIKKDDVIVVLTGNDKGKKGRILRVVEGKKVIVEGINLVKKHTKGDPQSGRQGGIIDKESALHISNVALASSTKGAKKTNKVGFKFLDDGRKVRYIKSNNELIDL